MTFWQHICLHELVIQSLDGSLSADEGLCGQNVLSNSASCYITLLAILHKNLMVSYTCLLEDGAVDNATKGHQFAKGHSLRNHGCLYRSG